MIPAVSINWNDKKKELEVVLTDCNLMISPQNSPYQRPSPKKDAIFVESDIFEKIFGEGADEEANSSPSKRDPKIFTPISSHSKREINATPGSRSTTHSVYSSHGSPPLSSPTLSSPSRSPLAASMQQLVLREERMLQERKRQSDIKRALKASVAKKHFQQDELYVDLNTSYADSTALLDGIDKELALFEEHNRTKARRQFEDWNVNVHGELSRRILAKMEEICPQKLHQQKLDDYDKFLSVINKKKAVFRDIIIENEYDPMETNRRSIRAVTGVLKDPTKIDRQKLEGERGAKLPKARAKDSLPVSEWADGKIQATPYGRKTGPEGESALSYSEYTSPNKSKSTQASSIVFDHFNYPTGKAGLAQLNAEMPKGKATFAKKIYANPQEAWGSLPAEAVNEIMQYTME